MVRSLSLLVLCITVANDGHAQSTVPRRIDLSAPNATVDDEFTAISSVRELSDGRLLVVDATERKLVVVDLATGQVSQLGRNGSGPGEYLQPLRLVTLRGDSTLLPDARNGRWLVLAGTAIAATVGPDAPAIRGGARQPLGADDRGNVIFTRGIGTGSAPTAMPRQDSLLLIRTARASGRADTVAVLRARPATIKIQGPADKPTSVEVLMNPLAAGELGALFPDGWIAIARLDPYRVDWISPDGKRTAGSPLPFERVRIDEREQRALVERLAANTGNPPRDPRTFPEWPAIMPPFLNDGLLTAPDGRLWIRRPPTAANAHPPYDVVDRRGALVARVAAGPDVRIVGFGRGTVYTVLTDDNGVQHLQRRSLPSF